MLPKGSSGSMPFPQLTLSKGLGSGSPSPPVTSHLSASSNPSLAYCVFTCLLYGVGSGSMAFFNKALVSSLGFSYSNALLTMQMLLCVSLFWLSSWTGIGSWGRFTHPLPRAHPVWGRATLYVKLVPLSLASCGNSLGGMLSLQGLSIPMFSVLKRFTPLVVCVMEYSFFGKRTTRAVAASLGLCMAGFILAGIGDLVFDARAYLLAFFSCMCQAVYLISVDRTGKEMGMASHELLYYNSLLSLAVLLPLVWYTGEMQKALFDFPDWDKPLFVFCLAAMLLLGISLSYCMFLCTQVNSPLTTCMVGTAKGIVTTTLGFFMVRATLQQQWRRQTKSRPAIVALTLIFVVTCGAVSVARQFGGQPVTALNITGVTLNTLGSSLYAWAKYDEKERRKGIATKSPPPVHDRERGDQREMAKLLHGDGQGGSTSP